MPKKKISLEDLGSMVFSTDPEIVNEDQEDDISELLPGEQRLRVYKDKKQRRGKVVTLIEGFAGSLEAKKSLAKDLKTLCGSGGGVKDEIILIQGDFVDKIEKHLLSDGYHLRK